MTIRLILLLSVLLSFTINCIFQDNHEPPTSYQIPQPDLTPSLKPIKATIKAKYLNIRSAPSTDADIMGFLEWDDTCELMDRVIVVSEDGFENVWWRLYREPSGWISGEFVEVDGEKLENSTYGEILSFMYPGEMFEKVNGIWRFGDPVTGYKELGFITKFSSDDEEDFLLAIISSPDGKTLNKMDYPSLKLKDNINIEGDFNSLDVVVDDERSVILLRETPHISEINEQIVFESGDFIMIEIVEGGLVVVWSGIGGWSYNYYVDDAGYEFKGNMKIEDITDDGVTYKVEYYVDADSGIRYILGEGFNVNISDKEEKEYLIKSDDFKTKGRFVLYDIPYHERVCEVNEKADNFDILCSVPWRIPPESDGDVWYAIWYREKVYWGIEKRQD